MQTITFRDILSMNMFESETPTKNALTNLVISFWPEQFSEKYDGKILFRTRPETPLQIFFKFMLQSWIIFKSMTGPDDIFKKISMQAWKGWMNSICLLYVNLIIKTTFAYATLLSGTQVLYGLENEYEFYVSWENSIDHWPNDRSLVKSWLIIF